ncbi:MAG: hypothetical protein JKY15_01260 [Deltaproteobacteria bacterium]|nr:hypothetical protein [Deltaproteobacteria bacterium]
MTRNLLILFLFFSICSYCETVEETSLFYYDEAKLEKELDELTQLEFKVSSNNNQQDSIVDRALYLKGIEDATLYYQYPFDFLSGFLLGGVAPFLIGFSAGIVTQEVCCAPITSLLISVIPPIFLYASTGSMNKDIPLYLFPEQQLTSNYSYMRGYRAQVMKKKQRNKIIGVMMGIVVGTIGATAITSYILEELW